MSDQKKEVTHMVNWQAVMKDLPPIFPKGSGSAYATNGTTLIVVNDMGMHDIGMVMPIRFYPKKYIEYWI